MPPTLLMSTSARAVPANETEAATAPGWLFVALSFGAGLLAPFTVNLVGQLPVGELVFGAALGYLLLWTVLHHRVPGWLLKSRLLWTLLACQGLAFAGYVVADFYRGSSPTDIARGWARMVFLVMDILAVAFLFGGTPRRAQGRESYVGFQWGFVLGGVLNALFGNVIFGDYWKFGYAFSVSIALLLIAPRFGFWVTQATCFGLGVLHMALDFRSMGALCLALPFAMFLQRMPRKQQLLALPVCLLLAFSAVGYLYYSRSQSEASAARGTRSDVERAAMLEAAWNGFTRSPFIGNGSWFSKSDVMTEFYALRYTKSLEAGVGSFTEGEEEDVKMVIHSQLLVGLAEGGILGGLFFLAYGAMLFWALIYCTFGQPWHRYSAIYHFTLQESFWGLGMSPFSGMHRMLIAVSTGLVLMLWAERAAVKRAAAAERVDPDPDHLPAVATALRRRAPSGADTAAERRGYQEID